MKKSLLQFAPLACLALLSCQGNGLSPDASGTFEVDEVIVSSEIPGKLLTFRVNEGQTIPKDSVVGEIDAINLALQKQQVEASIQALGQKTTDATPQLRLLEDQLAVQQTQLGNLEHEKERVQNLLRRDAATGKQLDDLNFQIEYQQRQMAVTRQQMAVQQSLIATQNRSILSEGPSLEKKAAQLEDQLQRSSIINPVGGTVLAKYAEAGEVTAAGKALYKIADLTYLNLRAYLTGSQLSRVKLGQQVQVRVDDGEKKYRTYSGVITWISDKAEFTPKTIQTKDERANLVYAIKVRVKNDGYLKIGMYGELQFQPGR
ncbi:MAG TPA: HlyD family efflux transporter periplasmic adaptor subunit [Chitinophagaceae bacterium]|nr:HlyD family efflux transporter periplasmic adaptor subunit [Chitinophagaceae bacterium]